jgi:ectoine hydroxylase-related dioxygenase (phytanoyl-CoA dioxygenase family)
MIYFQGAWLVDEVFHDILYSPRLTVPLCQLLGTDAVRFFHDQVFYKPARHGGIVAWHQDYSYWTRTTPVGHITCFLCLDDATLENGCLHVVPGSQKWNLLPKVDLMGKTEDMESIKSVLSEEQKAQFKPTPIFLKAGECSFHHCLTLHGSYPNKSDRARRSVVLNFMKPETKSASDQPLMPGAAPVQAGQVVDGDFFPITGCR